MTDRMTARVVGGLFIAADVAGVLALTLLQPVFGTHHYLVAASLNRNRMAAGALLEVTMGIAVVGIAVTIYSVLKRFSVRLALGYIVIRTMEGMLNVISAIGALMLLTVSQQLVSTSSPHDAVQILGGVLVAGNDWVNSAVLPIVFALDALILNYVLYRARLVPRWLSVWGLGAAALWLVAGVSVMYGVGSSATMPLAAPIGLQEVALALWLIVKGFNATRSTVEPEVGRSAEQAPVGAPRRALQASGG